MNITKHSRIAVVGVGKVGAGIVQAIAQAGFEVSGIDVDETKIDSAMTEISHNLEKLISKGTLVPGEKDVAISRINLAADLDPIRGAHVIIEAIYEDLDAKKELFKTIDDLATSKEALLLTNTSSLSISEIASVTQRPDQVAGMHFFNPVPVMKLVEVVRGAMTSDNTLDQVKELARLMGKTPIVSGDSPGFIVNRMLNALVVEAARIVEEGVGTIEDVDLGATLGCGHPMGPFELFDYLNAIHLLAHVTDHMADELGERFRLPTWVKNLVREGRTGRDAGKGFYDYD
ncbi:MAG: 3-hydroxyacyl-CoA dehydrogenase family protein [Deltaproteobacteria bacterium]|nr:3-hydroxyacyl-CoA dehydrogenase family protein [Deltaproteobacteria bacterium]